MLGVKKNFQANEGQLFPLTTPAFAPHDEDPATGPVPVPGSEKIRAP